MNARSDVNVRASRADMATFTDGGSRAWSSPALLSVGTCENAQAAHPEASLLARLPQKLQSPRPSSPQPLPSECSQRPLVGGGTGKDHFTDEGAGPGNPRPDSCLQGPVSVEPGGLHG